MNQTEIHLTVSVHELDIIMNCLMDQPFRAVAGLIPKIVNQANGGQPAPGALAGVGATSAGTTVAEGTQALASPL